jgi:hypothetical protein
MIINGERTNIWMLIFKKCLSYMEETGNSKKRYSLSCGG